MKMFVSAVLILFVSVSVLLANDLKTYKATYDEELVQAEKVKTQEAPEYISAREIISSDAKSTPRETIAASSKAMFLKDKLTDAKETLQEHLSGTTWYWSGQKDVTIEFREDMSIQNKRWSQRGIVAKWEVLTPTSVKFTITKGRTGNTSAVLNFSEDRKTYTGTDFDGTKLSISTQKSSTVLFSAEMGTHSSTNTFVDETHGTAGLRATNVEDLFLMATRKGIVIVDSEGNNRLFKKGSFRYVDLHDELVYIPAHDEKSISVWDINGNAIRTITFPPEVDWLCAFSVLPDGRIAVLDNNKDRVQFLSKDGALIHTVNLREEAGRWRQNMAAEVIDNQLVVIENGSLPMTLISLDDYFMSTFPKRRSIVPLMLNQDLLPRNAGAQCAITNKPALPKAIQENIFYTSWRSDVYEIKEGKKSSCLINLPEGNVTDVLADNEYLYMCLNHAGNVYRLNIKTGAAEVFATDVVYPCDMEPMPGSQLTSTRQLTEDKSSQSAREKAVREYMRNSRRTGEIVSVFQNASGNGDNLAKMWLARSYLKGRCGLRPNPSLGQEMALSALPTVTRFAEDGHGEACFLLASAYDEGLGVTQNYHTAVHWYEKSAEKGFPLAMLNLGWLIMHGNGAPQDIEKTRALYKEAALAGSAQAPINLREIEPGHSHHKIKYDELQCVPYINNIWKIPTDEYLSELWSAEIISVKPNHTIAKDTNNHSYPYTEDGIVVCARHGVVKGLELYNEGERGFKIFKGELPSIFGWEDTPQSIRDRLGKPDNTINYSGGNYGLVYRVENIQLDLVFSGEQSTMCQIVIKKRWP